MALGRNIDRIERNIESIESKFAKIFKRPKNREDGSDFDDFWTESIVSTQSNSFSLYIAPCIHSSFFDRNVFVRNDAVSVENGAVIDRNGTVSIEDAAVFVDDRNGAVSIKPAFSIGTAPFSIEIGAEKSYVTV